MSAWQTILQEDPYIAQLVAAGEAEGGREFLPSWQPTRKRFAPSAPLPPEIGGGYDAGPGPLATMQGPASMGPPRLPREVGAPGGNTLLMTPAGEAPMPVAPDKGPGFWSRLKMALPRMIAAGVAAGATPNVAGGGPVDILRGMQAGQGELERRDLMAYRMRRQQEQDAIRRAQAVAELQDTLAQRQIRDITFQDALSKIARPVENGTTADYIEGRPIGPTGLPDASADAATFTAPIRRQADPSRTFQYHSRAYELTTPEERATQQAQESAILARQAAGSKLEAEQAMREALGTEIPGVPGRWLPGETSRVLGTLWSHGDREASRNQQAEIERKRLEGSMARTREQITAANAREKTAFQNRVKLKQTPGAPAAETPNQRRLNTEDARKQMVQENASALLNRNGGNAAEALKDLESWVAEAPDNDFVKKNRLAVQGAIQASQRNGSSLWTPTRPSTAAPAGATSTVHAAGDTVKVKLPDGRTGFIPRGNLASAKAKGAVEIQ